MDILNHPDLLDRLAAAYALGTLRGGARRRFEALARQSPTVRVAALLWQERFASMTELQSAEAPSPNVWKRIQNLVVAERQPAVAAKPPSNSWGRAMGLWRGAALAGAICTIGAVAVGINLRAGLLRENAQLASQLQSRPDIQYVAVLSDEKSTASMLVTFDPRRNTLTLKRVGGYQEAADKSLQLWALPPSGGPRSLGVVEGGAVVRLTAAETQVREVPALAISLEPKGGVPPGSGPTGPVLFKGALLQTNS